MATTIDTADRVRIHRQLRRGDAEAIGELHRRIYVPEYGLNDEFVNRVATGVRDAVAGGWPERGGAVWIVADDDRLRGSLALTAEGDGLGRVRWFALEPELRGQGLGRSLIGELLSSARSMGMTRLELETFSALRGAAHIYRSVGFALGWERERTDWGTPVLYQHYALDL